MCHAHTRSSARLLRRGPKAVKKQNQQDGRRQQLGWQLLVLALLVQ
jgi:hypothetical protein